jgi:hypothetical protein
MALAAKPTPGDVFVHPDEGRWRVVMISEEQIGLSGPGPMRSYRTLPRTLLTEEHGWRRDNDRQSRSTLRDALERPVRRR